MSGLPTVPNELIKTMKEALLRRRGPEPLRVERGRLGVYVCDFEVGVGRCQLVGWTER